MGTFATTLGKASLFVQTDQPFYPPGSQVTGAVYLDAGEYIPASFIDLRVLGYEKLKWEEPKKTDPAHPLAPGENPMEKMKEKKLLISHRIPLHQIGGNQAPGQYKFPFVFQLPSGIPGTLTLWHIRWVARIKYSLTAVLVTGTGRDLIHRTEFIVRQQPYIPNYNQPVHMDEAVCVCCISKGRSTMDCNFQSDTYQPGETAYVVCKADNRQCTVPIRAIVIRLVQVAITLMHGHEEMWTRTITSKEYSGLKAGEDATSNPRMLDLVLTDPNREIVSEVRAERGDF